MSNPLMRSLFAAGMLAAAPVFALDIQLPPETAAFKPSELPGYALAQRNCMKKALETFQWKIRQITRRSGGRSVSEVIGKLRSYVLGWKAYFGLTQTPRVWRRLDEWMRHRMRAIHLKQWRRASTIYRALLALGANPSVARWAAAQNGHWWRGSGSALNCGLTISYFDRLGMPRLT